MILRLTEPFRGETNISLVYGGLRVLYELS